MVDHTDFLLSLVAHSMTGMATADNDSGHSSPLSAVTSRSLTPDELAGPHTQDQSSDFPAGTTQTHKVNRSQSSKIEKKSAKRAADAPLQSKRHKRSRENLPEAAPMLPKSQQSVTQAAKAGRGITMERDIPMASSQKATLSTIMTLHGACDRYGDASIHSEVNLRIKSALKVFERMFDKRHCVDPRLITLLDEACTQVMRLVQPGNPHAGQSRAQAASIAWLEGAYFAFTASKNEKLDLHNSVAQVKAETGIAVQAKDNPKKQDTLPARQASSSGHKGGKDISSDVDQSQRSNALQSHIRGLEKLFWTQKSAHVKEINDISEGAKSRYQALQLSMQKNKDTQKKEIEELQANIVGLKHNLSQESKAKSRHKQLHWVTASRLDTVKETNGDLRRKLKEAEEAYNDTVAQHQLNTAKLIQDHTNTLSGKDDAHKEALEALKEQAHDRLALETVKYVNAERVIGELKRTNAHKQKLYEDSEYEKAELHRHTSMAARSNESYERRNNEREARLQDREDHLVQRDIGLTEREIKIRELEQELETLRNKDLTEQWHGKESSKERISIRVVERVKQEPVEEDNRAHGGATPALDTMDDGPDMDVHRDAGGDPAPPTSVVVVPDETARELGRARDQVAEGVTGAGPADGEYHNVGH